MYAAALRAGAEICRTLGRAERAAEYERRAAAMIDRVNALCYDADAGLYRNTPSRRGSASLRHFGLFCPGRCAARKPVRW